MVSTETLGATRCVLYGMFGPVMVFPTSASALGSTARSAGLGVIAILSDGQEHGVGVYYVLTVLLQDVRRLFVSIRMVCLPRWVLSSEATACHVYDRKSGNPVAIYLV